MRRAVLFLVLSTCVSSLAQLGPGAGTQCSTSDTDKCCINKAKLALGFPGIPLQEIPVESYDVKFGQGPRHEGQSTRSTSTLRMHTRCYDTRPSESLVGDRTMDAILAVSCPSDKSASIQTNIPLAVPLMIDGVMREVSSKGFCVSDADRKAAYDEKYPWKKEQQELRARQRAEEKERKKAEAEAARQRVQALRTEHLRAQAAQATEAARIAEQRSRRRDKRPRCPDEDEAGPSRAPWQRNPYYDPDMPSTSRIPRRDPGEMPGPMCYDLDIESEESSTNPIGPDVMFATNILAAIEPPEDTEEERRRAWRKAIHWNIDLNLYPKPDPADPKG